MPEAKRAPKRLSVVVISITPFDSEGRLDESAFRRQLRRLGEAGVSVYVAGSGSSEAYTLSALETKQVLTIAVEELKGKVPVRAMGCEPHVAEEMIEFLQEAARAGVDAAQVCPLDIGHVAKPTEPELEAYYSAVLKSTSLPLYISIHKSVGYFLTFPFLESLLDRFPHIRGVSYSGSDANYLAQLIARVGDRVEVHCAGPANALTVLGLGGNGFMGNEGNFCPMLVQSVIDAFTVGDIDKLRVAYRKLILFAALNNKHGPGTMRAMKPLMNAFGFPGGYLRPPRLPIAQGELDAMVQAVLKLDLPGIPARRADDDLRTQSGVA